MDNHLLDRGPVTHVSWQDTQGGHTILLGRDSPTGTTRPYRLFRFARKKCLRPSPRRLGREYRKAGGGYRAPLRPA